MKTLINKLKTGLAGLGIIGALILGSGHIDSKAFATPSANILYNETNLGNGFWQYDYTFNNTSNAGESLYSVYLYPDLATLDQLNTPSGWDSTLQGFTPINTDFIDTYSTNSSYDISAGNSLDGFSFTINYQAGDVPYDAFFSGDNITSGITSVVPEPISSILFLSGGAALVARSYLKRKSKKRL